MKRLILAVVVLLAFPAAASAAHHHPKPIHCKKGTHRNGRKCVKNPVGVVGPAGSQGARGVPGAAGAAGVAGVQGVTGPAGVEGPPGAAAPTSPLAYDNITPETRVDNPVSLGYGATQTTQFGSQIALGREGGVTDPEVEVLLSVWSCEHGEWNAGCVSNGGSFAAPLTLNVYAVGSENSVGALLSTTTETFNLPYRPTSNCPTDPTKFVAIDGTCNHGLPTAVTFDVPALPHKSIVAVEYSPTGPLAALNVALEGSPTIGTNPLEALEEAYGDYGAATTFGLEDEWLVGEGQLAARVIG